MSSFCSQNGDSIVPVFRTESLKFLFLEQRAYNSCSQNRKSIVPVFKTESLQFLFSEQKVYSSCFQNREFIVPVSRTESLQFLFPEQRLLFSEQRLYNSCFKNNALIKQFLVPVSGTDIRDQGLQCLDQDWGTELHPSSVAYTALIEESLVIFATIYPFLGCYKVETETFL